MNAIESRNDELSAGFFSCGHAIKKNNRKLFFYQNITMLTSVMFIEPITEVHICKEEYHESNM